MQTVPILGGILPVQAKQYIGVFCRQSTINICSRLRNSQSRSSISSVDPFDSFASSVFYWCENPRKLQMNAEVQFRCYASQQEGNVLTSGFRVKIVKAVEDGDTIQGSDILGCGPLVESAFAASGSAQTFQRLDTILATLMAVQVQQNNSNSR